MDNVHRLVRHSDEWNINMKWVHLLKLINLTELTIMYVYKDEINLEL